MKTALLLTIILITSMAFNIRQRQMSTAPSYDIEESKRIMKLAATAFCTKQCVQNWTCKVSHGLTLTHTYYLEQSLTLATGYVGYRKDTNQVVLGFRGTINHRNWIEDANFEFVPYFRCPGCEVHAGFYADFLSLEKVFKEKVGAILQAYPTASILTTGHSLGAALALMCAIEFKSIFPTKNVYVHNFGQPRLGNARFASYVKGKLQGIIRVVHNKDIVPHVPPKPAFEYHHPPYEVFFNEDMTKYQICSESGQDENCSNKFFPFYETQDHDFYFIDTSHVPC